MHLFAFALGLVFHGACRSERDSLLGGSRSCASETGSLPLVMAAVCYVIGIGVSIAIASCLTASFLHSAWLAQVLLERSYAHIMIVIHFTLFYLLGTFAKRSVQPVFALTTSYEDSALLPLFVLSTIDMLSVYQKVLYPAFAP